MGHGKYFLPSSLGTHHPLGHSHDSRLGRQVTGFRAHTHVCVHTRTDTGGPAGKVLIHQALIWTHH